MVKESTKQQKKNKKERNGMNGDAKLKKKTKIVEWIKQNKTREREREGTFGIW